MHPGMKLGVNLIGDLLSGGDTAVLGTIPENSCERLFKATTVGTKTEGGCSRYQHGLCPRLQRRDSSHLGRQHCSFCAGCRV